MRSSDVEPDAKPNGDGASTLAALLRHARTVIITVVGVTVLLIGVVMIVLPGPAFVVIPLGLGILAVEWAWARRLLERVKREGNRVLGRK
jgi:tellurite resistance protein TerC